MHEIADEEIIIRAVENGYLPEHLILTIGEENFEQGIFNGIFLPIHAEGKMEEIIIVDVDKTNFEKVSSIVEKIKCRI